MRYIEACWCECRWNGVIDAIRQYNLGCVVMNPLGGGIVPRHPQLFPFLSRADGETVVEGALRFLFSHEDITLSLVGFGNRAHVRNALSAAVTVRWHRATLSPSCRSSSLTPIAGSTMPLPS